MNDGQDIISPEKFNLYDKLTCHLSSAIENRDSQKSSDALRKSLVNHMQAGSMCTHSDPDLKLDVCGTLERKRSDELLEQAVRSRFDKGHSGEQNSSGSPSRDSTCTDSLDDASLDKPLETTYEQEQADE